MYQASLGIRSRPLGQPRLPDIVDAIGEPQFESRLQQFLSQALQSDHFGIFRVASGQVQVLAADPTQIGQQNLLRYKALEMWRLDPVVRAAMRGQGQSDPCLVQADLDHDVDPRARTLLYDTIRERIFIYAQRANATYGLSIMRSRALSDYTGQDLDRLADCADLLLSVLAKHYEATWTQRPVKKSVSSVPDIERRIVQHASLPAREAAVCARLVYGMTTVGIALDLGIGEETVKTYRKRLWKRLEVGSPRELLVWYLELDKARVQ